MGDERQAARLEGSQQADSRTFVNLVRVPWQRKYLVLLGLSAGLLLGAGYYFQAAPVYEARAQVLVVKKYPDEITGMDTHRLEVEDYVSMQREILRSQIVLERAIGKAGLGTGPSLSGSEEAPAETLGNSLQITRNKGPSGYNNVLSLALSASDPQEATEVLSAIIDSYQEFLEETYHSRSDSTLELVKKARDEVLAQLQHKEAAYRAFRDKSPLIHTAHEREVQSRDSLAAIESRRVALLLWRTDIQGQLDALDKARKEGLRPEAILALLLSLSSKGESESGRRAAGTTLQDQLAPLLAEDEKLALDFGPNHPRRKALRKEIEKRRVFYASPSASWPTTARPEGPDAKAADPLQEHVRYLQQQLQHVRDAERLLAGLYDTEHGTAKKLDRYEMEDDAFRTDIARLNSLYDGIIRQLQNVRLVRDVGGYEAKIINRPSSGRKIAPKASRLLPAAGLLGLLLGCGLAFLADGLDKRFRTADEMRSRLGLPVIGRIPRLSSAANGQPATSAAQVALHPLLCTYHRPSSSEAEAYRAVRTALYFNQRGGQHRVVQISSPHAGDGKSVLAANLAVSIAQSGKTVLLVDAELRRPRLHKLFGRANECGLACLLGSDRTPENAVQDSGVPGLRILPCGPQPSQPAELLTSHRFEQLLAQFREQYDFVIVDTPPLLEVTDPGVVAPRVDGVLLTLCPRKCSRPSAERACEILTGLGANVIGVVINDSETVA